MAEAVIAVAGLRKAYGSVEAVRGVELEVRRGEVFAFLGPNGAGKTTTVEILEGFRERDAGTVEVLGEDPAVAGRGWRQQIGVVLQESEVPELLTVRESLTLFAGYFSRPRAIDETIGLVGLMAQADQRAGKLSGGQRRRLDVALALVGSPELLFLDEPTTGFDPAARRAAWEVIEGLRELGTTILLTTHYLEEAERLADRVGIIKGGVIVAEGPPASIGGDERAIARIRFVAPEAELPSGLVGAPARDGRVELRTTSPVADLALLCGWATELGIDLPGLEVVRPSLEDVYLELTAPDDSATPEHSAGPA
jgi:ABC-2 type transport system ATP-binding protein